MGKYNIYIIELILINVNKLIEQNSIVKNIEKIALVSIIVNFHELFL